MTDDRAYFARRAKEEERAAARAIAEDSRPRHLELAELLSARASASRP